MVFQAAPPDGHARRRPRGPGLRPARHAHRGRGVPRYIGRIGLRDDDYDVLLIDWRAPAAAVFYQATQADPLGVVRRRILRSRGVARARGRGRPDRPEARTEPADRRRGRADGPAVAGPRPVDALDRGHHPGRAGPRDPGARQGRRRRSPAVPAPARPWLRCTVPPTCSTATAGATRPVACSWSAPRACSCATSSGCCPRWARPRWRCGRSARSSTASGRPAATSPPSPRSRVRPRWPSCCVVRRGRRCPDAPSSFRVFYRDDVITLGPRELGQAAPPAALDGPAQPVDHARGLDADRRDVAPGHR